MALTDAVRAPGVMVLVLWKETDVVPNAFMMNRRKRKGETKRVDRCIVRLYVTVTEKDGPAPADAKLPAQILIVTGVDVAACGASVAGTPEGGCQTRLLLVDGQAPGVTPAPETATFGISDAVPWLSMQKYAGVAAPPEVNDQGNGEKPVFTYLTSPSAGHEVGLVKVGCVRKMLWPALMVDVLLKVTWVNAKLMPTISIGITKASSFSHLVFIVTG